MKIRGISQRQEIDASIANKLTLPLVVLEAFKQGKKIDKKTIAKAIKELKSIAALFGKQWISKE